MGADGRAAFGGYRGDHCPHCWICLEAERQSGLDVAINRREPSESLGFGADSPGRACRTREGPSSAVRVSQFHDRAVKRGVPLGMDVPVEDPRLPVVTEDVVGDEE